MTRRATGQPTCGRLPVLCVSGKECEGEAVNQVLKKGVVFFVARLQKVFRQRELSKGRYRNEVRKEPAPRSRQMFGRRQKRPAGQRGPWEQGIHHRGINHALSGANGQGVHDIHGRESVPAQPAHPRDKGRSPCPGKRTF